MIIIIMGTIVPIDGIDHIQNNKICLEFEPVDTLKATKSGMCDVYQNQLLNGFSNLKESEIYVYLPELSKLLLIDSVRNNKIYLRKFGMMRLFFQQNGRRNILSLTKKTYRFQKMH